MKLVSEEIFFSKGVGRHKEKLASLDEALRDAKIAPNKLAHVLGVFPQRRAAGRYIK